MRSDSDAENHALLEVKNALELMGNPSLSDFGLPLPTGLLPLLQESQAVDDHVQQLQEEASRAVPLFNVHQKTVFKEVVGTELPGVTANDLNAAVSRAQSTISKAFFLGAPAGTGKTFVTRAIHAFLRLRSKKVIDVATSAVAAALLDGGRAADSTFKISILCDYGSNCNVSASSQLARQLREADLIFLDEAVMAHKHCIEAVHRMLQDKTKCSLLFRGLFSRFGIQHVVDEITDNVFHLRSVTGAFKGERLALPRVKCRPVNQDFPIPGFTRRQFPVRNCFAMTTYKSQGQSIRGRLGIDLTDSCFSYGQLYVALSGITDPRNLYVSCANSTCPRTTKNIVYREVLD